MRYKILTWLALALGMALAGTSLLSAQDRYDYELREGRRDLNRDYATLQRLRYQVALDRQRLNEDRRCGRYWAAQEDARDLARDRWALDAQVRHIRRDRAEMYRNYRGYR
jgi:hypothetical protein